MTAATTAVLSATYAPDGHRIAYSLDNVGSPISELSIEDLLTGDKRQLARDQQFGRESPRWSPDGSRLAYVWQRVTGTRDQRTVAVRPAAGGDELPRSHGGDGSSALHTLAELKLGPTY